MLNHYVNRQNPKVKTLLSTGKGRTPLEKLLDAAAKDKNIVEISRSIQFEDKEIASIKVAISIEEVNQNINKLVSSFETLVSDSNNKINQVLDQESMSMLNSLKNGFNKVNALQIFKEASVARRCNVYWSARARAIPL